MKRRDFLKFASAGAAGAMSAAREQPLGARTDASGAPDAGARTTNAGARRLQPSGSAARQAVTLTPNESARRVDVSIGGQPFTSYIWPDRVKKPVLDPIRGAKGTFVTRGWPLDPRPGERVDHPHHVGLWFNYESVNGVDFWNNSDALKPADAAKMGTILHRTIVSSKGGADRGELTTEMDWVLP